MKTIYANTVAKGALPGGYYLEYSFSGILIGIAPIASPTADFIEKGFRAAGYTIVFDAPVDA